MSPRLSSIIHPAPDMDAAKALFGALLGKGPDIDQPHYAAFDVDGVQVGLAPPVVPRASTARWPTTTWTTWTPPSPR